MKKLTIGMLALITLGMSSCYYLPGRMVVISITKTGNSCIAELETRVFFIPNPKIFVECNEIRVGDTIKLTKL